MTDLLAAGALVLVIEGLLWAVAPRLGLRLLIAAAQMPEAQLRMAGAATMAAGAAMLWFVRG
jgi:uncharacterized protein YjeT (DUF2065 family)